MHKGQKAASDTATTVPNPSELDSNVFQRRTPTYSWVIRLKGCLKDFNRLVYRAARKLSQTALRNRVTIIKKARRIDRLDAFQNTPRATIWSQ
jgi:hypothetical protein